jgi:hypothetical protein
LALVPLLLIVEEVINPGHLHLSARNPCGGFFVLSQVNL